MRKYKQKITYIACLLFVALVNPLEAAGFNKENDLKFLQQQCENSQAILQAKESSPDFKKLEMQQDSQTNAQGSQTEGAHNYPLVNILPLSSFCIIL